MHKPHKANDGRWEAIQAVRDHDGMLGLNHFRLVKRLGYGDIGSVYLSELSGTRTCFAMKVMDKAPLDLIHDSCQLLIASGTPQPIASVPQLGSFDMVHKRTTSCLLVIALSLLEVLLSEIFRLETTVTNQAPIVHWVPCCLLLCTCKLEVHTLAGFLNTWFISHLFCLPLEHRFEKGRKCHGLVVKIGLEENVYVGNAFPCMYAKCGVMRDAMQVFGEMAEPNEVTFTAMMGGLKQTDRVVEALEMFRLMCRKGMRVDSVSLSSMLGVCAKWCGESSVCDHGDGVPSNVNGQQIHGLRFEGDLHLSNSLLDMYAKSADRKSAVKVFPTIPEVSVVSWNVIITGYGLRFQSQKSIEYLRRMQFCDFEPDDVTYINLLAACVKSGDIKSGCHMFDNISCPNVISGNAILSGYFQIDDHMKVIKLFREMQFQGVKSDRSTLAIALSSSAAMEFLEAGKEIHAASCKIASDTDMLVCKWLFGFQFSRMVHLSDSIAATGMEIHFLMLIACYGAIGLVLAISLAYELVEKPQCVKTLILNVKLEDKFH